MVPFIVLIPEDTKLFGFTINLLFLSLYFIIIVFEFLGLTFIETKSPVFNPWVLPVDTVIVFFDTCPYILS